MASQTPPLNKGLKRACSECGTRFYDMNKRPIRCPNCNAEFTLESKVKSGKIKTAIASTPKKPKEDTLKTEATQTADTISAADDVESLDELADIENTTLDTLATSDTDET